MINFIAIDAIYLLGEPMNGYWEMDTGSAGILSACGLDARAPIKLRLELSFPG